MRTLCSVFLVLLSMQTAAWGDDDRVQVVRPQSAACDAEAWQRKGPLRPLLRPLKVVRSDKLIVDFKLEGVSPGPARIGTGGITNPKSLRVSLRCSEEPGGRGIATGPRVMDPDSGLAIQVGPVPSAERGGSACGVHLFDPEAPARFLDVPLREIPDRNGLTGIVLVGDSVYLLVQFNGYAKEINGQGNLIVAGDLCSHRITWRSPNVVSNAPALVLGEYLITGYGFTKEPDWLFVLDRRTGRTVQKLSLPKSPEGLRAIDNQLFVQLYDGYAVFGMK